MTDALLSRSVNALVIHHSASPRTTSLKTLDGWHKARGMDQIGYHHVILGDASLVAGRPLWKHGAHAAGHNTHSIGLCVVGDNTKPAHAWSDAQITQLAYYVLWFQTFFPDATVLGHRDLPDAKTACPGLDVRALLKLDAPVAPAVEAPL